MSIALHGISFSYPLSGEVLNRFSLRVDDGEVVAVVGPSGSGKSTLLGIVGLLLSPHEGLVELDGTPIPAHGAARARRDALVGWVFQSANVLPSRTVLDNATVGLLAKGMSRSDAEKVVMPLLEAVGLGGYWDRQIETLSGGEVQRVCITRAVAPRPAVLLADEPTGQLDSTTSGQLADFLIEAARMSGASVLVATHDAEVACRCDRTIDLRREIGR